MLIILVCDLPELSEFSCLFMSSPSPEDGPKMGQMRHRMPRMLLQKCSAFFVGVPNIGTPKHCFPINNWVCLKIGYIPNEIAI